MWGGGVEPSSYPGPSQEPFSRELAAADFAVQPAPPRGGGGSPSQPLAGSEPNALNFIATEAFPAVFVTLKAHYANAAITLEALGLLADLPRRFRGLRFRSSNSGPSGGLHHF